MDMEMEVRENTKNIAVLQKEVQMEIQGLKGAFHEHAELLKEVSGQLNGIFNKLSEFVRTHDRITDRQDWSEETLKRHNAEIIELQGFKGQVSKYVWLAMIIISILGAVASILFNSFVGKLW